MIPYGRQDITQEDVEAVESVLRSAFLTQGPAIPAFEAAVARAAGTASAVAASNATAALHIAYLAADVGPGDVVWTSPNTFLATANAALYCGASVDFVDVDPGTLNLCPKALQAKLEAAKRTSAPSPKVVVPVHFGGEPCRLDEIADLGRAYGFRVVEDASHAIGGSFKNHPIGDGSFSDMAVFSFHPVKIVTTGEGGAVCVQDPGLLERLQLLRSHGMTRETRLMRGESEGGWYYQQIDLGFNYRMTDIQAALGASQMRRLRHFIDARQSKARVYDEAFGKAGIGVQTRASDARSALHLYVIRWPDDAPISRGEAFARLRAAGIGVNLHYIPVYLQPYYADLGFEPGLCPNAEDYYRQAITLPLFPLLTESEQAYVIDTVLTLAGRARA